MEKEQIDLAWASLQIGETGLYNENITSENLQAQLISDGAKIEDVSDLGDSYLVKYESGNVYVVSEDGEISEVTEPNVDAEKIPQLWMATKITDEEWYSYNDVSNGNTKANVNFPKLKGNMTAVKYSGADAETQTGSKWANAITADGSMWVWIPRYAYKITYTDTNDRGTGGTIEVAFINTSNKFLNGESGEITTNPEEEGAGTTKWLVHPAFTSNATYGGGFGELSGIWIGKFEATGTYNTESETGTLTVKPGEPSLCGMTINQQYKLAKSSTFGETVSINSHMAKNSEWGMLAYLAHSKYGTNGQKVENNNGGYRAGGTSTPSTIYTTNKKQSTTHNATGVYDMNGGAWERTASYVYISSSSNLQTNGGLESGDLYGANAEEQSKSTAYKTVYESVNNQATDYTTAKKYKGDAVYETSNSQSSGTGSWFSAYAYFPSSGNPFFGRGGYSGNSNAGTFCFNHYGGNAYSSYSFRPVLAF